MFLKVKTNGDLVEIMSTHDLFDPFLADVNGRYQRGEEVQDAETFHKMDLRFPSNESLPECWTNPHYRDAEMQH